jgi:hypothetical protein
MANTDDPMSLFYEFESKTSVVNLDNIVANSLTRNNVRTQQFDLVFVNQLLKTFETTKANFARPCLMTAA